MDKAKQRADTPREPGAPAIVSPAPWDWRCSCGQFVLRNEGHICWPARQGLAFERIAASMERAEDACERIAAPCVAAVAALEAVRKEVLNEQAYARRRSEESRRDDGAQQFFNGYSNGLGYASRVITDALAGKQPAAQPPSSASASLAGHEQDKEET